MATRNNLLTSSGSQRRDTCRVTATASAKSAEASSRGGRLSWTGHTVTGGPETAGSRETALTPDACRADREMTENSTRSTSETLCKKPTRAETLGRQLTRRPDVFVVRGSASQILSCSPRMSTPRAKFYGTAHQLLFSESAIEWPSRLSPPLCCSARACRDASSLHPGASLDENFAQKVPWLRPQASTVSEAYAWSC